MTIKITPRFDNTGPEEKLEFWKLIQELFKLGYTQQLLHYTDDSVLMRKMTDEELKLVKDNSQ